MIKANIYKSEAKNQMTLCYDGLYPDEAKKLIDCFDDDELCELLEYCDVDMSFAPYRINNHISRDLVLFIKMDEYEGDTKNPKQEDIDEAMEADRQHLEKVAKRIYELSGIGFIGAEYVYTINGWMKVGNGDSSSMTNLFIGVSKSEEGAAKVVKNFVNDLKIDEVVDRLESDGEVEIDWPDPHIGHTKGYDGKILIMKNVLLN